MRANYTPMPPHPAIVSKPFKGAHGILVSIRCPDCEVVRNAGAADIRRKLAEGSFTGYCGICIAKVIGEFGGGRDPDLSPLPIHPAIVSEPRIDRHLGRSRVVIDIRCPRCEKVRTTAATEIRREIQRPNFRGYCRPCALVSLKDGTHRYMRKKTAKSRSTTHGYIRLLPHEVPDKFLPMYRTMQKSGQAVLEHRFVMAKHLGRPLTSNECVDHMDGDKTNNAIENLRLYVRGKQQPGSCPGHGTYYHEWQNALREIERLKAQGS